MADNHQVGADDAHSRDNPSDNSNDAADAHRREGKTKKIRMVVLQRWWCCSVNFKVGAIWLWIRLIPTNQIVLEVVFRASFQAVCGIVRYEVLVELSVKTNKFWQIWSVLNRFQSISIVRTEHPRDSAQYFINH